jgi:hypothetical protein
MRAMQKTPPAASPDAYVAALTGWRRRLVEHLRANVLAAAAVDERIKWGHIVCFDHGPLLLIRAEARRVLFGFWRGKRLGAIEPRLVPGGKFELATMQLRDGDTVDAAVVRRLVKEAVHLNRRVGDPTDDAKPARHPAPRQRAAKRSPRRATKA